MLKNGIVKWNKNIISTKNGTCEKKFNDVPMEKVSTYYPNLEIKSKRVPKNGKK